MTLERALLILFGLGIVCALVGYIVGREAVELAGWILILIGAGGEVVRWLIRRDTQQPRG